METERDNATQGRSDEFRTTSRAAPHHGTAIVGNRLASLRCNSGHHRQAQRGRHEHRAALASKPAAAPGLQGQASFIGRWGSLARAKRWCPRGITCVASPVKPSHLQATSARAAKANAPLQREVLLAHLRNMEAAIKEVSKTDTAGL